MGSEYLALILIGALAGGFVSGLAGFGTGITALGLWLFALSPSVAATLVLVCSAAAQIQTLPRIWRTIEFKRVAPFILPGLCGVPLGTVLLSSIDVRTFKLTIGGLILAYSLHSLVKASGDGINWGGRAADGLIGFGGGILGGLAGLSGPLPTVWADIRGWSKEQRRSVFQVFNLSMMCAALVSHFMAGFVTMELGIAAAIALPGTFIGSWLGFALYARVSERQFKRIVLTLLAVAGSSLILTNL